MIIKGKCELCGEEIDMIRRDQKYCGGCRKKAKRLREREYKYRARKEDRSPLTKEVKWDEFDLTGKSLARVDAEARLFGMSYGQYTAAVQGGSIMQILKHKGVKNPKKMLRELKTR